MKKTLLMVAIAGLALASCKKARTCTCTSTDTNSNGIVTTGTPTVTEFKKISKKDARNQCITSTYSSSETQGSTTNTYKYETTCTLK